MAEREDEIEGLGGGGKSPISTGDAVSSAIQDAIAKNPAIMNTLKSYFTQQIVKTGVAVGCFDMATVSFGLTLQSIAHTPLVWLPISCVLYSATALILKRVMK